MGTRSYDLSYSTGISTEVVHVLTALFAEPCIALCPVLVPLPCCVQTWLNVMFRQMCNWAQSRRSYHTEVRESLQQTLQESEARLEQEEQAQASTTLLNTSLALKLLLNIECIARTCTTSRSTPQTLQPLNLALECPQPTDDQLVLVVQSDYSVSGGADGVSLKVQQEDNKKSDENWKIEGSAHCHLLGIICNGMSTAHFPACIFISLVSV